MKMYMDELTTAASKDSIREAITKDCLHLCLNTEPTRAYSFQCVSQLRMSRSRINPDGIVVEMIKSNGSFYRRGVEYNIIQAGLRSDMRTASHWVFSCVLCTPRDERISLTFNIKRDFPRLPKPIWFSHMRPYKVDLVCDHISIRETTLTTILDSRLEFSSNNAYARIYMSEECEIKDVSEDTVEISGFSKRDAKSSATLTCKDSSVNLKDLQYSSYWHASFNLTKET